jgi:undecaprenyl-diphosphatase
VQRNGKTTKTLLMKEPKSAAMKLLAEIDARLYVFMGLMEERLHLYKIARAVSFTGDGYAYLLVAAVLLIVSPEAGLAVTLCGFLAFAFELPTYAVLKKTFKRRRPYLVVERLERIHDPSDEFSFPSGHTAGGFLMAYIVSHFFPGATLSMYIWASSIGISRVFLRVHFVSDILAGAALGTGFAIFAISFLGY